MTPGTFTHHLSHSITKRAEFQRWAWESEAQRDSTIGSFDEADWPSRRAMCRRVILARCQIESRSALLFDDLARAEFEQMVLEFNRATGGPYQKRKFA
ncbi:MAG: hypothetical protein ACOVVK_11670 [Elsteraceae bacterium]